MSPAPPPAGPAENEASGAPAAAAVRRLTPLDRVGAVAEIVLCSGFPTQIFLTLLLAAVGMRLEGPDASWSPQFVTALSLLDTILVIGLVWMLLTARGESPREVLLGHRPWGREAWIGLALLPLIFVAAVLVLALILGFAPGLHNVTRNPLEAMLQNRRDAVVFGIVAMVAGGVREEIQRGFILHRFTHYLGGGWFGVLIYSTIFGLGHLAQGRDVAIVVATLGAIWGTIYISRRSIVAPMVSHAAFNLAQVIKFLALR